MLNDTLVISNLSFDFTDRTHQVCTRRESFVPALKKE